MKRSPSEETDALRAAAPRPGAYTYDYGLIEFVRARLSDWLGAVVDGTSRDLTSAIANHALASDRFHAAEALSVLQVRRQRVIEQLTRVLSAGLEEIAAEAAAAPAMASDRNGPLKLTLIDEAQIDEEIEIARMVQHIESEAEWELLQLQAMASGLRGLATIDAGTVPLSPQSCATGLRSALGELGVQPITRLLLLRHLGLALGRELKQIYPMLSRMIQGWGIEAAPYRVTQTATASAAGGAATTEALAAGGSPAAPTRVASAALQHLVERARASVTAGPAAVDSDPAPTLRLLAEPLPAERVSSAMDPAAAVDLMERLLGQIEKSLAGSRAALAVLAQLRESGRSLAARETALWSNPDHAWWRLLDRLIAMGSVFDDAGDADAGSLGDPLARVSELLREAPTLDGAVCSAAAAELQQISARRVGERITGIGDQIEALQRQVDREEVEVDLRNQIIQQLRSTPVCPRLRQFLVGPWAQVLTGAAARDGLDSAAVSALALVVDDLIRATAQPGRCVSKAQQRVLLRQVREALASVDFPPTRAEAELDDLEILLRDPPPVQEENWEDHVDTLPAPVVLSLHGGLPTVPIAMVSGDSTLEGASHQDWLDTLGPGAYCRLFLLGRWFTAQLSWVGPSQSLFVFSSRHGGRTHSLTRRMLGKLRNAGLATRIEDGFLLAQAMQDLADTDFAAG